MISSNGSNGEDTLREYHGATTSGEDMTSGSNVLFHIQGSNEASPNQKSPDDIKVIILCMCVCVCMYVCMYVYMYVCMYVRMYHTCPCMYRTCPCMYIHMCMHA